MAETDDDLIRCDISVGWTVRNEFGNSANPSGSILPMDTKITKEIGKGVTIWSIGEAHLVRIVEPDGHVDDDPYGRADWYKIISQVALRGDDRIRWVCAKRYDPTSLRDNLQRIAQAEGEIRKKPKA
jgi:hypothetical protein